MRQLFFVIIFLIIVISIVILVNKERERNLPWKFIHIAKNGGTGFCLSVQKTELCCDNDGKSCKDGSHHLKLREYDKAYNFIAIVRNPYDRFISAFSHTKYLSEDSFYYGDKELKRHLDFKKYNDVNHFVEFILLGDETTSEHFNNHSHFFTQTDFLTDSVHKNSFSKRVKMILQLENIDSGLKKLQKVGFNLVLPKTNKEKNKTIYPKVKLNEESLKFIERFYKYDFINLKKLGYNYTYK